MDTNPNDDINFAITLIKNDIACIKEQLRNAKIDDIKKVLQNQVFTNLQIDVVKEQLGRCVQKYEIQEIKEKLEQYVQQSSFEEMADQVGRKLEIGDLTVFDNRIESLE